MPGAGRILACIAVRESGFQPNAHNFGGEGQAEVNASWRAYNSRKDKKTSGP